MLGEEYGTTLAGGVEVVGSGGVTNGNLLISGGVEIVAGGGIASSTLLSSGAIEIVSSGGLAVSTGIPYEGFDTNVGELIISSGGTASSGYFQSGSVEIVASGGTAIGDDIGGYEVVQAGGLARDVTLYDGGTLEVASGGLVSGKLIFNGNSAGSTLTLDAGASFQGLVADFGAYDPATGLGVKNDQIDLEGIGIATTKKGQARLSFTEAASNQSGTLTVTDGVHTASIQLLGQYMASEFVAASDGHGGTLITFTTATQPGGHLGHSNSVATPVTS